jgi:hypothetical protein
MQLLIIYTAFREAIPFVSAELGRSGRVVVKLLGLHLHHNQIPKPVIV